jgi:hypothetical protein
VFIAFEVLWEVDTRVKMHLDGAFAMLGSLPEIGVDERKYQKDDSSGLAAGANVIVVLVLDLLPIWDILLALCHDLLDKYRHLGPCIARIGAENGAWERAW